MNPQPPHQEPPYGGPPVYVSRPTNGTAIAALVLSLLIIPITTPIGLILAYVARRQIKRTDAGGWPLTTAALIIGWVIVGIFGAMLLFVGVAWLIELT